MTELSTTTPHAETVLTVEAGAYNNSWDGLNGLLKGPGYTALANRFPPGTRLHVTVQAELPEDAPTVEQALATCGDYYASLAVPMRHVDWAVAAASTVTPGGHEAARAAEALRVEMRAAGTPVHLRPLLALIADHLDP